MSTNTGSALRQEIAHQLTTIEPQSAVVRDIVSLLQQGMTVPELKEVLDLPRLKDIKADTCKIEEVLHRLDDLAQRMDIVPERVVKELSDSDLMADVKHQLVELATRQDQASVSTPLSTPSSKGLRTIEDLSEQAKLEYASQRILKVLATGLHYKASELAAETGFTRQWVYKVLYKGWREDHRHSLSNPDPDSLLGQGKIVVVSTRVPFRFKTAETG